MASDKKVDFAYLLEKYGPKRKRPPPPPPKYYEKGFSVQFQLSHAYRALEKQEQEVSRTGIKPKAKLSRKALRALMAENPPKPLEEERSDHPKRSSFKERVNSDIDKFKEIGRKKREEIERVQEQRNLEEDKANGNIGGIHGDRVKVRSATFWRQLMSGKSISSILENEPECDETFITNANPDTMLLKSKHSHRKHKTRSRSKSPGSPRRPRERSPSPVRNQSRPSAVVEWEKRRRQRNKRKLEQNIKIKKAINAQKFTKLQATNDKNDKEKQTGGPRSKSQEKPITLKSPEICKTPKSNVQPSLSKPPETAFNIKKSLNRPKSAPVRLKPKTIFQSNNNAEDSIKDSTELLQQSQTHSSWTKHLRSNYLNQREEHDDVPSSRPTSGRNTTRSKPRPQSARIPVIRDGAVSGDEEEGQEGEKNKLMHRPTKFLFDMCKCQKISKQKTLEKLLKTKKVGGIIELHGCSGDVQEEYCPFCAVLPRKRIEAWMEDVEYQTGLFLTGSKEQ